MDIGQKIKLLRLKENMTLEELGNKIGVGKSTVRKWENGIIINMRMDKISLIADALHTTPAYIMGLDDTFPDNIHAKGKELEELETLYLSLNEVGKQKVLDIIKDYSKIYSL